VLDVAKPQDFLCGAYSFSRKVKVLRVVTSSYCTVISYITAAELPSS